MHESVDNLLEDTELSGFSADEAEVSDSEDNNFIPTAGNVSSSDEDSSAFNAEEASTPSPTQAARRYAPVQSRIFTIDAAAPANSSAIAVAKTESSSAIEATTFAVRLSQISMKGRNC